MKGKRVSLAALILSVLLLVTGCASGTAHVTVKKNGSLELAFSMLLSARAESLAGGKLGEVLTDRLAAAGIELDKSQSGKSTEYKFFKTYQSFEELQQNAGSLDIIETEVAQADKWLYTRYEVAAQPKLNAYTDQIIDGIGSLNVPESLVRLMLQNLAVNFKLTLPYNVYGPNNADSQEGNTLTWRISMADTEPVRLVVYVPQVQNIAIAAGGLVLIIGAAAVWFVRARKGRQIKQ
ncbi:hypothetical protein R70723_27595 [Paenibacillus sp. FSL R7-0273]|uniref:hypothetical protein n=1 Tax=Paenibacillus sp. FSL R7-0273 TaxID=1536772 RepID=UPI0004F60547|nr:hypothetical protein [Paenibacillus sp. FSL R7-0273]AIQ49246.1 hypothetical protein R70723_27595 [Paenibacillus sp. FSL R7-0273]OMF83900.1 hypothetical protein BK144_31110 [Paenibacillus sp. FSL R7-0273]